MDISSKDDVTVNLMKETSMKRRRLVKHPWISWEKEYHSPRYSLSAAGFWIDIYRQRDWFFIHLGYFHGLFPPLSGVSFKIPSFAAGGISAYKDPRLRLGAT